MNKKFAEKLIQKNKDAYNKIAGHFDSTRSWLWKDLYRFSKYAKDGDSVLDFGCGNGRLLGIFKNKKINYFGIDASSELLLLAEKNASKNDFYGVGSVNFKCVKDLSIPFSDKYFDNIYSIAVLHHIPTKERRLKLLKEFNRVLSCKGKLILTNWNLRQKKYRPLVLKYALKNLFGQLEFGDVMIPWKNQNGDILTERYYHSFSFFELKKLLKKSGFKIIDKGYFGGVKGKANLYIVAEK